ncbi:peptidase inhibitor 16-like [Carassius carassius]|uniref:peptidase inhibitor 16-like n=1 Tax=Carassius carassius TaxID=217509 RepID=UPI00286977F2|nr:peptidase inhibitor 16-like [Carassius carassius]XP_059396260.1 peptidase inhibitor 16-like [Carassius carassius]
MYWNVALQSTGLWVILSLAAGHLTEQEKSTIVDMHNEFRSKVQPSAAFMQKVVWDETLRLVAENHTANCIVDHNPLLKELRMGENIFSGSEPFNAIKAMMEWFGEHEDYNFETKNCDEERICANYIQMVWANSSRIGCAAQSCDTTEHLGHEKVTLFVCNYYPSGNIKTQNPYESGVPCSRCTDTLPVCEGNMCVADDTKDPTVSPEHPQMTTDPAVVPEEPTHNQGKIVTGMESKPNHGSKMDSISAPLLTLVWLLVL